MDKVIMNEDPAVHIKKYVEPELNRFSDHFFNSEGYENEVLGNLLEDTNEDTVLRILAHFNENLKEGTEKLKMAKGQSNCETVWKTAHKNAGSAELLGFRDYANRSRELSRIVRATPDFASHEKEINSYREATENLSAEISTTCPGLNSYL